MTDDPKPKLKRSTVRALLHLGLNVILVTIAVLLTIVLVTAFASRSMPSIEKWHHEPLENEFVAKDLTADYDLEDYLKLEQTLFNELSGYMLDPEKLENHSPYSRYVKGGAQDPGKQTVNWNRTIELVPTGTPKGGVLLLHGLSDSPYSLRSQAETFHAEGFYVLAMRMPGHGTVPAGLLEVTWRDWAAAVKMGARHVQSKIGKGMPFYIGGYSNGGALAVQHTLQALENGERTPDRLFLFSPAIGITAIARVGRWDTLYSFIPYFEKSKWTAIQIEFDPYKYNSFTKNAATQSWRLANEIQVRLAAVKKKGDLDQIPPILTFQSVVDATVDANALIAGLYSQLESQGNEVIFFGINRSEDIDGFLSLKFAKKLDDLMERTDLNYKLTKVSNLDRQTSEMSARTRVPGLAAVVENKIHFTWPDRVFSLAHVAIPFPEDDPLYGEVAPDPALFGLHIGSFHPIGERRVFSIPPSQLIRIRHNPFHAYMNERMLEAIRN